MGAAAADGGGRVPAVELIGIDKRFGTVHANRNVNLRAEVGSIHGIVGENGAGKSTLMSILYGFYQADRGEMRVRGQRVRITSPRDAIDAGVGMVHQHFMLVDPFTVLENVMLGAEGGPLLARGREEAARALEALEREYALDVPLDGVVGELPVGIQQRVEILKALYRGADTLILDEPTGVLTPQEAEHLFRILGALRDQGKTVLLITHKLKEIMSVTDRVAVMRRGEMVADRETAKTTREELAELMVGRKVLLRVDKTPAKPERALLAVEDLRVVDRRGVERLKSVSFQVRAGEILGIAGVAGNGQSELLAALSGITAPASGRILIDGQPVPTGTDPHGMRRLGMAHVPEDRLRDGLVPPFEARENIILGYHDDPRYNTGPLFDRATIRQSCLQEMQAYDVRPSDPELPAANFSGGNQQKLVVAREVERDPAVLLVGQPTRGVDIGAIEFIHRRLVALRDSGKAIVLVSVELDEIMSLADRILVMFDGRIAGEMDQEAADERVIGCMMAGVGPEDLAPEPQRIGAD